MIVVIGAGMVGLAQAIALASEGIDVTVIDREDPSRQLSVEFDGRVSAIAWKSYQFLDSIGAWSEMIPHGEPILDIRVSEGNSPLFLHFDHNEIGNDPFGYIIENRHIRAALYKRAESLKNLKIMAPAEIESVNFEEKKITVKDAGEINYDLLIAADGKNSIIRKWAGIKASQRAYNQQAIVCTIEHDKPHSGLAHEKFLPKGPFAVLPMQNNRSSLVWCEPADIAHIYMKMSDAEFNQEIMKRVNHLGNIKALPGRWGYKLDLTHAETYMKPNLALIGDAAHSIHPIAGQGVNLGFRDAITLTKLVVGNLKLGLPASYNLSDYSRLRRLDNMLMITATDTLNRLFSNNIMPFKVAREYGLGIVNQITPLRRFFMQYASGKF